MISAIQEKVKDIVEDIGLFVIEEYEVPPYWLDLFLPELGNKSIEVDGPYHVGKSKDNKRDEYILECYGIQILRIKQRELRNIEEVREKIIRFIEDD